MCKVKALCSIALTLLLLFFAGCKKGPLSLVGSRHCWQVLDGMGNPLQEVCNKSESQMKAMYPNGCRYYKNDGEKFCWLVGNVFLSNLTKEGLEMYVRCYNISGGTPQKAPCNYCQHWYHRLKRTYKPATSITYSPVYKEYFCGDTASKIFQGRQVVLKDTPDSLVVRQFSRDAITW
jgi:hypothetical protein